MLTCLTQLPLWTCATIFVLKMQNKYTYPPHFSFYYSPPSFILKFDPIVFICKNKFIIRISLNICLSQNQFIDLFSVVSLNLSDFIYTFICVCQSFYLSKKSISLLIKLSLPTISGNLFHINVKKLTLLYTLNCT